MHRSFRIVPLLIVCIVLANAGLQQSAAETPDSQRTISTYGVIRAGAGMTVGTDFWSGTTPTDFQRRDMPLIRESGIQMLRLEFNSGSVPNLRTLVPAVTSNGIKVLGLLLRVDLTPNGAIEYGSWVYSVVSEFKNNVHVWEIMNEPNLDKFFSGKDPAKYTEFLKQGYTQAKRADPTCTVLGGSVVFTHQSGQNFVKAIYTNGGKDYMDALSFHPYCDPYAPNDTSSTPNPYVYLTKIRDIMVQNGDSNKKIWITEVGWSSDDVGEANQALYIGQALTMALNWGFIDTYIHFCWHGGTGDKGLVSANFQPKPAFYTVKDFTASL